MYRGTFERMGEWEGMAITMIKYIPLRWLSRAFLRKPQREWANPQDNICSSKDASDFNTHTMHEVNT